MYLLTSEKTTGRGEKKCNKAFRKEVVRARDESRDDGVPSTSWPHSSHCFLTLFQRSLSIAWFGGQAGWYHPHLVDKCTEAQRA